VRRAGPRADGAELQAHVKATLSPHKYPRDVRFLAALPRTGSGKVDRRALRNLKRDSPSLGSEATA
jgi:acyl-coenzyme A synthetase/AMP-(fatty) acid ligase